MRAIKIAWLHSHFLLWAGGTKFVYEVCRRVHKQIPVDMYVEQCSDKVRDLYAKEGINVFEINTSTSRSKFYWLFFPFYVKRDIERIAHLRSEYPLIVTSMFPMNYVALCADIPKYLVYLFEPFAFFHDREMISGFPFLKRWLLRLLASVYKPFDINGVRHATSVMTINDGTAKWVKEIYGVDAKLTHLATDPNYFNPARLDKSHLGALRARYRNRKIIIHSTDYTPLKRTWDAVEIMEDIKEAEPKALLLITQSSGNRKEIERLTRYIKDRSLQHHVQLLGYLDFEELPYFYSLADIFLYTGIGSGASAASLFVLECMACGTPGIRTNFTTDEVEDGVSGYLYEAGAKTVLKEHILDLLQNDEKRELFGRSARETVVRLYSWDAVANSMVKEIRRLVQDPQNRAVPTGS